MRPIDSAGPRAAALRSAVWFLALSGVAVVAFLGGSEVGAEPVLHLELRGSEPEADTVLTESPEEVRLFFSEPPQMQGTSVRLADPAGELVPTTDAEADPDDPRQVHIDLQGPLAAGTYTVHWRVIAQDGHAQNGDFVFTLQ